MVTSSKFTPSLVKLFEPVQTTYAAWLRADHPGDRDVLEVAVEVAWMPPCLEKIVRRTDIREPVPLVSFL